MPRTQQGQSHPPTTNDSDPRDNPTSPSPACRSITRQILLPGHKLTLPWLQSPTALWSSAPLPSKVLWKSECWFWTSLECERRHSCFDLQLRQHPSRSGRIGNTQLPTKILGFCARDSSSVERSKGGGIELDKTKFQMFQSGRQAFGCLEDLYHSAFLFL